MVRQASRRMATRLALLRPLDLRLHREWVNLAEQITPVGILAEHRQKVYGDLGLHVVNHTSQACLGCFLPTRDREPMT